MKYLTNDPSIKSRRINLRNNMTEAEKYLWSKLRSKQLNGLKFRRQFSIGNYIVDFYNHKYKLAIELDGQQHGEKENEKHDNKRTKLLNKYDIKVVRFWNFQVLENIDAVLDIILQTIKEK